MIYPFSCPPALLSSHTKQNARSKNGFNLIEATIVLGVVGLVIGGIWVAAAAVSFKHNINSLTTAIAQTVSGIKEKGGRTYWVQIAATSTGTETSLTQAVYEMGIIPRGFLYTGAYYMEPYFGKLMFDVFLYTGADQRDINILLETPDSSPMGQSLCINLSRSLIQAFYNTGPANPVMSPTISNALVIFGGSTTELALNSTTTLSEIGTACTSDVYSISVFVPF